MPWSGNRNYNVNVAGGELEVNTAIGRMRTLGVTQVFLAGHGQGGVFALYFGGKYPVDGIVAIAPGGNSGSQILREKLSAPLAEARKLAAAGKGAETARLQDFDFGKGGSIVICTPDNYLTWFEPDGAMNQLAASRRLKPGTPVLFIVPKDDHPGLLKVKQANFDALPRTPLTRLYEPEGGQLDAPKASREEVARWILEVANAPR